MKYLESVCFLFLQMLRAIGGEGSAERQMRQEVVKLRQQLQSISMVDQFATYARVQRKINTLNQQYKDKGVLPTVIVQFGHFEFYFELW